MKILQSNYFNYPVRSYQITPCKKNENNKDIFVRSNNSLSFTGQEEETNPYKQIMQNPNAMQKVMELVTNAAAMFVAKAMGGEVPKTEETSNVDNIFATITQPQEKPKDEVNELELLKREMREMREENRRLRELIERRGFGELTVPCEPEPEPVLEQQDDIPDSLTEESPLSEDLSESEPLEQAPEEEKSANYVFEFPKKKVGILSKSQKELKSVTTNIKLDKNSGEKLTGICKELLQKGSHEIDGQTFDNKELADQLSQKLKECSNEEVPQVVDEFYKKCGLSSEAESEQAVVPAAESEEIPASEDSLDAAPKPEIYQTERIVLPGITIKGKINLDEIKDRKKGKAKSTSSDNNTEQPSAPAVAPKKRPRIAQRVNPEQVQNPKNDFKTTSELRVVNNNSKTSIFTIPGTVDPYVKNDLTRLLLYFEELVEKDIKKPRYQCCKSLSVNVLEKDVLDEIREQRKRDPESPYVHINKSNASEIADTINSDPRFHEMFAMHAAMRLIDRYVDFNSEEPLDKQCKIILDKLEDLLKKSFKEGVEVRRYKDTKNNIGARIIIPEKAYDESAKRIFGAYPLGLGLSENQPKLPYYDVNHKEPLIYTVFIKGI